MANIQCASTGNKIGLKKKSPNRAKGGSGAQKRAEMLRHPCILGDPQTKGDKIRSGCLTPAFSGAQKRAEMLRHPCILRDPLTPAFSGAQKRAEMLRHPCLLGGPKEGGNATSPLHSRGSPNKGGQNQKWVPGRYLLGGPKEGGSATSAVHSWGSPTPSAGTKSEAAHRWAHRLQACIFSKIGNFFFAVRPCNFFVVNVCRKNRHIV